MSPSHHRQGLSAEPNPTESDSSGNATLFGDPDPEIFIATIPFPEPNAHSRRRYVQYWNCLWFAALTAPAAGHCPFRKAIGSIPAAFTPMASKTHSPFVSLSKFVVGNDKIAEVKQAFRQRPHLVSASG
jgi:hypothetical protein